MTVAERIEMLDNSIYVAYKTYFDAFGPVRVPESGQLADWWTELEQLEAVNG